MILTPDELSGRAMDWAYELARNPDAIDMKVAEGRFLIHLADPDSEFGGSGWYRYKRRWTDLEEARTIVAKKVGAFIIVPTDLVSPKYAHLEAEMEE
jgi:hypothetical protein